MKAIKEAIAWLNFFKDKKNTRLTTMIKVQSCIAELEALQQRSCDGCKYEHKDAYSLPCAACVRNCDSDYYEPKEQ